MFATNNSGGSNLGQESSFFFFFFAIPTGRDFTLIFYWWSTRSRENQDEIDIATPGATFFIFQAVVLVES